MPFLDFMTKKRNRVVLDNGVTNAQKIKSNFLSNLWNWTNLYSVVNTNSFVDFLVGLGVGSVVCFLSR